jgi:hypothetical protein
MANGFAIRSTQNTQSEKLLYSADYHLLFFLSIRRTPAVEICL